MIVAVLVIVDWPSVVDRVAVAVIVTVFVVDCGEIVDAVTSFVSCPAVNCVDAIPGTTLGSLLVKVNVSPLVDARFSCSVNDTLAPARTAVGETVMVCNPSG